MSYRFVIIGAGIAGASLGYRLAEALGGAEHILILERESQPGYHSTGRSAAVYTETYGPQVIRALTAASRPMFDRPPEGFSDTRLMDPLGVLLAGGEERRDKVEELFDATRALTPNVTLLEGHQIKELVPVLRDEWTASGVYEPDGMSMDVAALHQGYLRGFRAMGGTVATDRNIKSIARLGANWFIETDVGSETAEILVNTAGAWADEIAKLAGIPPLGLVPKRRTMLVLPMPAEHADAHWPMFNDIDENFYFKPDAGRILASPEEATPSAPCDAQPDEYDVAVAIDRLEKATTLDIQKIENRWAGLRNFFDDGIPAVGFDPRITGFFWLAGQGGYGITTSDAMARCATALLTESHIPGDIQDKGVSAADLDPARLLSA